MASTTEFTDALIAELWTFCRRTQHHILHSHHSLHLGGRYLLHCLNLQTEVMAARMATAVPAAYFDRLIATLDQPGRAPALTKAARRARRSPRIRPR